MDNSRWKGGDAMVRARRDAKTWFWLWDPKGKFNMNSQETKNNLVSR